MSEDRETLPPRPKSEEKSKGRLLDWLDAIAKLVGAAAVLAVALIVNSYWGDRRNRVLQSVAGVFNDSAPAKKVMIPTSRVAKALGITIEPLKREIRVRALPRWPGRAPSGGSRKSIRASRTTCPQQRSSRNAMICGHVKLESQWQFERLGCSKGSN